MPATSTNLSGEHPSLPYVHMAWLHASCPILCIPIPGQAVPAHGKMQQYVQEHRQGRAGTCRLSCASGDLRLRDFLAALASVNCSPGGGLDPGVAPADPFCQSFIVGCASTWNDTLPAPQARRNPKHICHTRTMMSGHICTSAPV